MQKINKKAVIKYSIILCIAICGCLFVSAAVWHINSNKEPLYLTASYSYNYASVDELCNASDLVAVIQITDTMDTSETIDHIPMSDYQAAVLSAAKEDFNGQDISIKMTGGLSKSGRRMEIADDPLMEIGDQYLVFLKENQDGSYRILGGPAGRFVYNEKNDTATSLCLANPAVAKANSDIGVQVENESVTKIFAAAKKLSK